MSVDLDQSRPPVRAPAARRLAPAPARLIDANAPEIQSDGQPPAVPSDRPRGGLFGPGWPLKLLLCGFPLWWVLGMNTFIFPAAAIVMAVHLRRRSRSTRLRWPSASWMWVVFLVWQVLGLALLNLSPPGTHPGSTSGRLISAAFTLIEYGSVTITMLYVANLPRDEVPFSRIGRWLGWFFLTVLGGGLLGLAAPRLSFTSVAEILLPHSIAANQFVASLVHPVTAQVQSVLGTESGRPSAPFGYTNVWANALSILLVWFVAAWLVPARGRTRIFYLLVLAVTVVPVVLSLNRGLWIGIGVTVVWLLCRTASQGHLGRLLGTVAVAAVATVAVIVSPLGSVIAARLQNGVSDQIRAFVDGLSISAVRYSPILGFGGNRHANGSATSIAIGPSPSCPNCGDVATGSTGQLWETLFNQGVVGTLLYFGFFAVCVWMYRRQRGALAEAALVTIVLTFVYALFYNSLPVAPTVTVIAVALLWREREADRAGAAVIPRQRLVSME